MTKAKLIGGVIGLFYLPLSFYLMYLILAHIDATELMWFVWVINIPLVIVISLIEKVLGEE